MDRSPQNSNCPNKEMCKYRNLKHENINRKMLLNILLCYNYYLQPLLSPCMETLSHFREVFGFLLLLLSLPFLMLMGIVTFITRIVQIFLFAKCVQTYDTKKCIKPFRTANDRMITFVVWLTGSVDTKEFLVDVGKTAALKWNLEEKYGVLHWSLNRNRPEMNLSILHLELMRLRNNRAGFYGFKSGMEQLINNCLKSLNEDQLCSWKITLIPHEIDSKPKACCILQFHSRVLEILEVQKFLRDLIGASSPICTESLFPNEKEIEKNFIETCFYCVHEFKTQLNEASKQVIEHYRILKASINLIFQQYNFHTKSVFIKVLLCDTVSNLRTFSSASVLYITNLPIWKSLKEMKYSGLLFLRGISYMPFILVQTNIWSSNPLQCKSKTKKKSNANRRNYFETSWSQSIPSNFLEIIATKENDISKESIILTTCGMGIKEYLLNWNIPNPGNVKVLLLTNTNGCKVIRISTNEVSVSRELKRIESRIKNYPLWKEFGFYYFQKVTEYLLPFWILRRLDINRIAPITFKYIDLDTPNAPAGLSSLSLFGYPVEDVWTYGTSLIPREIDGRIIITAIKYRGYTKLSIFSGIESLDTALAKMFPRYLNRMAEVLGIEKPQIPYSQKSSPSSSSSTSPLTF